MAVSIDTNAIRKLHLFNVDKILGRLSDDGTIHAKLYIAYLHALTSFCLPDSLTRMTGTEQALSILRSAGVASFDQLSKHDISVLVNIANLTPTRNFQSRGSRQMQTVRWNPQLSSLSQPSEFTHIVARLLYQHIATKVLYPGTAVPTIPRVKSSDKALVERDLIRSSTVRNAGFGAEHYTDEHDRVYVSRDRNQTSQRAKKVFHLSNMVYHKLNTRQWLAPKGYLRRQMKPCQTILPPNETGLSVDKLKYDISLMQTTEQTGDTSLVQTHWPTLHSLITQRAVGDPLRHALMCFVTTMGWSESINHFVLQCLCLIFTTPAVADVTYPATLTGEVSPVRGSEPLRDELETMIRSHIRPFRSCPESSMAQDPGESKIARDKRVKRLCQSNKSLAMDSLVGTLLNQWPVVTPVIPADLASSVDIRLYIDVDEVMTKVADYFEACHRNNLFFGYLKLLESQVANLPLASGNDPTYIKLSSVPSPASTMTYVSNELLFSSSDDRLMQMDASPVLKLAPIVKTEGVQTESPSLLSNVVAKLKSNT